MALRTPGSIMKFLHPFVKCIEPAQETAGQQVGLSVKGSALQTRVVAFRHYPLHILLRDLKIFQQHAFELVAAFHILRNTLFWSSDQPSLPLSIASRRDAGPWKYPRANSSISRTLSRLPATAFTKHSISACVIEFMRLNWRNVYM